MRKLGLALFLLPALASGALAQTLDLGPLTQGADGQTVGTIIQSVTASELPRAVIAAYDAPFPDESYKAGARAFPRIIPVRADDPGALHNRAVWRALEQFDKPFVTAFSDADPTTAAWAEVFQRRVPGARQARHTTVRGGHFLQEDSAPELAEILLSL